MMPGEYLLKGFDIVVTGQDPGGLSVKVCRLIGGKEIVAVYIIPDNNFVFFI